MHSYINGLFGTAVLLATGSALALNPGERVDNFRLLDHTGASHELHYLSDMKAVVIMTQSNTCEVARKAVPQFNELRAKYESQGVKVFMLNSALGETRETIGKFAADTGSSTPVLMDELQLIGETLAATQAGEVLVIDPADWKLAYRGPIGKTADAIDALLAGKPVTTAKVAVAGCAVKMPELANKKLHTNISYAKTIAPMLEDKCIACHRTGGIGPWQMSSYEVVKGFSPMIREVLRTERMPPWHADPHYGTFRNDRSLTNEETKTLVHWIEAGAPRGAGPDPLALAKREWAEWQHGKPDVVIELAAFDVPATGVIDYQRPEAANPIGEDVWLRAVEFVPGDRGVVHHMLVYSVPANVKSANAPMAGAYLGGYVPGAAPIVYPENTGIFLSKDSKLAVQMHYTVNGKPSRDVTRIGLYFTKEAPKFPLRNVVLANPGIRIPPNTKDYTSTQSRTFDRDILLYTLTAHAHYRGRAANYVAFYPDGRQETLLSVPHYDFNWQTTYELKEPKILPKGTKLVYTSSYDNSVQNKANPDPNIEVRWGEQSWQEMLYGNVRFRYLDEMVDTKLSDTGAK